MEKFEAEQPSSNGANTEVDDEHRAWRQEREVRRTGRATVEDLELISRFSDITEILERNFPDYRQDSRLLSLQRDGYKAEARDLLKSLALPEERQPIAYTREQRLQEAQEYADLAGANLSELVKQANITGVPEITGEQSS